MRLQITDGQMYMVHFYWARVPGREECTAAIHVGPCAHKTRPCETPDTGVATVKRFVKDLFLKSVARREALTRAIASLHVPRATRREIWHRYYQISRIPKARRGR
jgi:hypothetical protein